MKIEVCTHCWRYSRLLCYQLSSFRLHPPREVHVTATIFYSDQDFETVQLLDWFAEPLGEVGVRLNRWPLPTSHLLQRSIGRHEAAKATQADWIWMTDADYLFGERCLDSLPEALQFIDGPLAFPRHVYASATREMGDRAIERIVLPGIHSIEPAEFRRRRIPRAIGGVQIYRGETAREQGYLPPGSDGHRTASGERFLKCRGDVLFRRKQLRTSGLPVRLPNVYRVRHTQSGRNVPGLRL